MNMHNGKYSSAGNDYSSFYRHCHLDCHNCNAALQPSDCGLKGTAFATGIPLFIVQ
jgi:hypothetical protein